jgi:hypothetical protein
MGVLAEQIPDRLVFKTLKLFPEQLELTLLVPIGGLLPTFTTLVRILVPQAPTTVAVIVTCPMKLFYLVAKPVCELIDRPLGLLDAQVTAGLPTKFCKV